LNALIERALEQNLTVAQAVERITGAPVALPKDVVCALDAVCRARP